MKTDRRPSPALAVILLAAAAAVAAAQAVPPADKPAAAPPPLVRMEYLKPRALPAAAPKRDIFSPGGFAAPDLPGRIAGGRAVLSGTTMATTAAEAAEAPPIPALNLRFIGFSYNPSRNRIIGLILLDGIASAVAEGESLANGLKIVRITRRELEVQGPDGKTLTFALEGVER